MSDKPTIHVAEGEDYEFDPADPTIADARLIEKVTGQTYTEWGALLGRGSFTAIAALVYTLRKRSGKYPGLRFDDVEFSIKDFRIEGTKEPEAEEDETVGKEDPDESSLEDSSKELVAST